MDAPPKFAAWSPTAVRLLKGVVYNDDAKNWGVLLSSRSMLEDYFARIGLLLVVDESEGMAYLRQFNEDECPDGYDQLPKLYRRSALGYGTSILCVLLREAFRRFEEEDVDNERCAVEAQLLFQDWQAFFPPEHDEVRQRRQFALALRRLEELGFVRKFSAEPETWEVRRILKARLPAAELENLKAQLLSAAEDGVEPGSPDDSENG